jgi:hypothetical protein
MQKPTILKTVLRLASMVVLAGILIGAICEAPPLPHGYATITAQPQGGQFIQTLTCGLELVCDSEMIVGSNPPMVFDVTWHSPNGAHKSEKFSVEAPLQGKRAENFVATFSAPSGLYLDKEFWVVVSWNDETGKHTIESEHAVCVVP